MSNPYEKNLSTVFKTLRKAVKGNANAEIALNLVSEHISRKTNKSRPKTAKTYGIEPSDLINITDDVATESRLPRSEKILQLVRGIGRKSKTAKTVMKEFGVCEADLNYLRKWGWVDINRAR